MLIKALNPCLLPWDTFILFKWPKLECSYLGGKFFVQILSIEFRPVWSARCAVLVVTNQQALCCLTLSRISMYLSPSSPNEEHFGNGRPVGATRLDKVPMFFHSACQYYRILVKCGRRIAFWQVFSILTNGRSKGCFLYWHPPFTPLFWHFPFWLDFYKELIFSLYPPFNYKCHSPLSKYDVT